MSRWYAMSHVGVKVIVNESDLTDIQAEIEGPVGTPYEGGLFRCKLAVENDFPNNPPKGYFITKIFHPNVSEKGEICVNTLKKDWNPAAWSLIHILEVPPPLCLGHQVPTDRALPRELPQRVGGQDVHGGLRGVLQAL